MMDKEYDISKKTAVLIILFSAGLISSIFAYHLATYYYHPITYVPTPSGWMPSYQYDVTIYPYKDYALPVAIFSAICYIIPLTYTIKRLIKKG